MLNREIREGYKVVLAHVEKYVAAGDQIILRILEQKNIEIEKHRRQLLANLAYYEQHASEYSEQFDSFDLGTVRKRFIAAVKGVIEPRDHKGELARVLDAGCGTGRDTAEFIRSGFAVTAFDPSPAMLRFCSRKIRAALTAEETATAARASRALELTFDELTFRNEFVGVWAAASLLHISPQMMQETLQSLVRVLKPNGILYFSLKYGSGEHERDARYYTYHSRNEIRAMLQAVSEAEEVSIWLTDAAGKDLPEDEQRKAWNEEFAGRFDRSLWLNVLARKVRG